MKQLISAAVMAIGFGVTPYVYAGHVTENCDISSFGILSTKENRNRNLDAGTYDFAQVHTKSGSAFTDFWGFSLAEDSAVSISIFDLEVGLGSSASQQYGEQDGDSFKEQFGYDPKPNHFSWGTSGKLLDNKFLALSLFDEAGNLVGSTGENGTLSNLALNGGERYTLSVSAAVKGLFGSAYHGSLAVTSPSAVPIGDSLPFFASALGLLGLRYRKRLKLRR